VRAFIEEIREAEAREERGEPGHLPEMILRLTRAAIVRNTVLEERLADEKDASIHELQGLRTDLADLVRRGVRSRRDRARVLEAIERRFDATSFPFGDDRAIPRVTVRGSVAEVSLDHGRADAEWTEDAKRALIARGYELADRELRNIELGLANSA
jgi:hypothetical protein